MQEVKGFAGQKVDGHGVAVEGIRHDDVEVDGEVLQPLSYVAESGVLWAGEGCPEPFHAVVLAEVRLLLDLKVVLDTFRVAFWNKIDAVALVDGERREHWGLRAQAGSAWGRRR